MAVERVNEVSYLLAKENLGFKKARHENFWSIKESKVNSLQATKFCGKSLTISGFDREQS